MVVDIGLIVMSSDSIKSGYYSQDYAESLSEFGDVVSLPGAEAWILARSIPNSDWKDVMGCYPLLCCNNWSQLCDDIASLENDYVSFSCVSDPLGAYANEDFKRTFDFARFYKKSYVVDLAVPERERTSRHHLRELRRAEKRVDTEICKNKNMWLDDWNSLYRQLIRRHNIRGLAVFSASSFERQFSVPGFIAYRACRNNQTVGMVIWYVCGKFAYHHLGAYSDAGYRHGASYALMASVLRDLARIGVRWVNLGAAAGVLDKAKDGLALFKSGWATDRRSTYFCGKILDHDRYQALIKATGTQQTDYFPAYREGEFG